MTKPAPRIFVVESVVPDLVHAAKINAPYECGGLLLGVRTPDGVWITQAVEINSGRRHRSRFTIARGETHPLVDRARQVDERIGYVGDWHSHPANAGPSDRDFATLRDLVVGVMGRRRLLGLVRLRGAEWSLELWAAERLKLPRRVEFELTGPLPQPGDI